MAFGRAAVSCAVLVLVSANAAAQTRPEPRGFLSLSVGAVRPGSTSDTFTYEAYVETATATVELPARTNVTFDAAAGRRVWRRLGLGVGVAHAAGTATASVDARVPHPLLHDRHRTVQGESTGLNRSQTAVHVQLYFEPRLRSRVRLRLFAGPSFYTVRHPVAEAIEVDDVYPFDEAVFRSVRTSRVRGSAAGAHAGIDVSWPLSRRLAAGGLFRVGGASVDLEGPGSRRVESNAGGVELGAGLRVVF